MVLGTDDCESMGLAIDDCGFIGLGTDGGLPRLRTSLGPMLGTEHLGIIGFGDDRELTGSKASKPLYPEDFASLGYLGVPKISRILGVTEVKGVPELLRSTELQGPRASLAPDLTSTPQSCRILRA